MKSVAIAVVGGGPAGLCATTVAAKLGIQVTLIEDNPRLGGQLIKQTHKFFGSRNLYCGTRGIAIATLLENELRRTQAEVLLNTTVIGHYEPKTLGLAGRDRFDKLSYRSLIVAAGAAERPDHVGPLPTRTSCLRTTTCPEFMVPARFRP